MKLVLILWIDSNAAPNEWEHLDGIDSLPPPRCRSVGYLLEETDDYVTLAPNITESQVCGRMTIPRACIQKCITLEDDETRQEGQ